MSALSRRYRLPDATRIGAVRLQVADVQRSIDYYSGVIGLRVIAHEAGGAALGVDGEPAALVFLQEKRGVTRVPSRGAFGLFHFAILLPDRSALGRFASHTGEAGIRMGMADHLVSEALYLTDPDGLGIEVYADRPRDQWRYQDQELVMATEPLDIRGVMASAAGSPWQGAPPGTSMGHVHLHVGDLEQAAAFYHTALGFDRTVWSYPGALFMSAGGYHHHLATNTWSPGPSATDSQARLLEWELVVPGSGDAAAAASALRDSGYHPSESGDGWTAEDPWGTRVRIKPA